MTKILYMIACLKTGGSEAYLLNLVRNLNKDHYQITVWCEGEWGPAGDDLRKEGATVIQQRLRPRPGEVIKAIRLLRRERFDVVHSLKYGPTYIDPLVSRVSRIKVFIGSRRNLPHWVNSMQFTTADRIRNWLTDHVVANSEYVKKLTIGLENIPAERITVLYNGVNLSSVDAVTREDSENFRKKLEIPSNAMVIGNVADLREDKGQSYLIRAFAQIIGKTDKDLYLIIQGEGPEETNLRSLTKELGIENRVRINTTRQKRFEVVRSFQIFADPALEERFPNAILEAMAMSLPTVATEVGGIPEVVVNDVTGIMVPAKSVEQMADAILKVINDPVLAKELGSKGRERVEKQFTVNHMAQAHERLYEDLLKKK